MEPIDMKIISPQLGEAPPEYPARLWLGLGTSLLVLMVASFAARVYTKWTIARKWTIDDTTCAIAFVGTIVFYTVVTIVIVEGHFGAHIWTIPSTDLQSSSFLIAAWIALWLSTFVFFFLKSTFFLLYLSIFSPSPRMRFAIHHGLVTTGTIYIGFTAVLIGLTVPRHDRTWHDTFLSSYKLESGNLGVGLSVPGLVLDLYILILPIVGVAGLQLDRKKRWGIIVIFLTGIIACVASAMSIAYRVIRLVAWKSGNGDRSRVDDITYYNYPVLFTTFTEMPVGIICACMPAMAALWKQKGVVVKKWLVSWGRRDGSRGQYSEGSETRWYGQTRIGNTYERLEGEAANEADWVRLDRTPVARNKAGGHTEV